MSLIKYDTYFTDPFSEMDRWFNEYFGGPRNRFAGKNQFPVDVYTDEDTVYVIAELPGFSKKDLNLNLHNAVLNITVSSKADEEGREHSYHLSRSITVGDEINASKVKAKYENGVLTVTLPKAEERKPKSIKIA